MHIPYYLMYLVSTNVGEGGSSLFFLQFLQCKALNKIIENNEKHRIIWLIQILAISHSTILEEHGLEIELNYVVRVSNLIRLWLLHNWNIFYIVQRKLQEFGHKALSLQAINWKNVCTFFWSSCCVASFATNSIIYVSSWYLEKIMANVSFQCKMK